MLTCGQICFLFFLAALYHRRAAQCTVLIMVTETCLTTLTVECYNKAKCLYALKVLYRTVIC